MPTHMNAFAALTPVAPSKPRRAYIEPTDRCNTRCLHCRHYHRSFGADMPEAIARKAVAVLAGGADVIVAQGYGEPLIARSFYTILEACEQRGTPVAITSNGILLYDEALVRRLVRAPVHIVLSIDGARPEAFHFVRPLLDWNRLLETLALYQRCRLEAGAEAAGSMSFHCVAMKDTVGDLGELVRMARRYGVGRVHVQALAGDNGVEKLRGQSPFAAPEVVAPALLEGMAVARELGVNLDLPRALLAMVRDHALAGDAPWQARLSPGARRELDGLVASHARGADAARTGPKGGIQACRQPWDWTFIASDGIVHACCMRGPVLGNLGTQEWDAIWNGHRYQSFRRLIHSWNPPLECRRCILPDGINAGDDTRYERYFGQFHAEPLDLDSGEVVSAGEFRQIGAETGQRAWRLDGRAGALTFPYRARARFLCLRVAAVEEADLVTGTCTINDGDPEPFDLSSESIFVPVDHVDGDCLEVRFEMADLGVGAGRLEIRAASLLV